MYPAAEKIERLKNLIQDQTRKRYQRDYPTIHEHVYFAASEVKIIPGKKYTKIDVGSSGKYMIDAEGNIWGIKAYGQIHHGHHYGTLDTIDDYYWGEYVARKRCLTNG